MKKIGSVLLFFCSLILIGCGTKEAPAEITLLGENQEEISYQFSKTSDPEEVKEIFQNICAAERNTEFNGVALDMKTSVSGNVIVTNQEVTTIDLEYSLGMQAEINLKKYLLSGSVNADGYANTNSDSLAFKSKLKTAIHFVNDDHFLYAKGILEDGDTRVSIKHKYDISLITQKYKTMITSFIDLMKYYRLEDFLDPEIDYVSTYQIVILKTTKDSFTVQFQFPANLGIEEVQLDSKIPIEIEVYCSTLLPKQIRLSANELVSLWLENKYVEQYISSQVEVKKAKLDICLDCNYDYFVIEEITEEEKDSYKEFDFSFAGSNH